MGSSLADLERRLNLLLGPAAGGALPRAIAMTDVDRAPDPARLLRGLPGGGMLILRDRNPDRLAEAARAWVPAAHRAGHKVLIAGDARLALATGADGVHLAEAELRRRPHVNWVRLKPGWIVTASAHGAGAVGVAAGAGADAALLSPVFPTESHPDAPALGALRFAALAGPTPIAVFALGGVTRAMLRRLRGAGCAGIAGIGLFLADSDG